MLQRASHAKYWLKRAKEKFGSLFSYNKVNYTNANTCVIVTCKVHGDFKITPYQHLVKKTPCPACFDDTRLFTEAQFLYKARKIHGNTFKYSRVSFVNSSTKVEIICKVHGSFFQLPYVHAIVGCGCPLLF